MATRGRAGYSDSIGIDPVASCIRAQKSNGAFAIFDVRGKGRIAAEAVEETCGHETLIGQQLRAGIAVLVAAFPAATVNPKDCWSGLPVSMIGNEYVHQQRLSPAGAVLDVGDDFKLLL